MRHRIGIILAVGMLAAIFFGGAWGYLRLLRLPVPGTQLTGLPGGGGHLLSDTRTMTGLIAVAATGLLAGILIAMPRISPLAAGLPGLVLLGWELFYLINVRQAVDLIPLRSDPFGAGFEAMLFNGTLAAAGFAMIVPMVIPSRWRRAVPAAAVPDTFPISTSAVATEPVTLTPEPAPAPTAAPVLQPSAVFTGTTTRMDRVATAPATGAQGSESPWQTATRAAANRPGDAGSETWR